jgi:hypothetical protein
VPERDSECLCDSGHLWQMPLAHSVD